MPSVNRIKQVIRQRELEFPEFYAPKAIAARLGVHPVTMYGWMGGQRLTADNLLRLAADLHVPAESLREWVPDDAVEAAATG